METVQLDKKRHNRKDFDCEVDALNEYLHSMASQHSVKDNTRTYVLENSENPSDIVAFPMVIVDAKDGVVEFYEKFEFSPFLNEENKLYLPIATIRSNFAG